jgi:uncharacterized membrane protein
MQFLGILAALAVLIIPILALSALVRARRLRKAYPLEDLVARIQALEERLTRVEKPLSPRVASEVLAPSNEAGAAASVPRPIPQTSQVVAGHPTSIGPPDFPKSREVSATSSEISNSPASPPHVSQAKSSLDLETLIAGHWLNRIGILALIGALTFFLKHAFDNDWIGPSGRVAIGILLGASMLPWSHWLLHRGYSYFSEGIAGLGAAVLYLSIWAGCRYYTLYSRDAGFAALIVVTAAMATIALRREAQRIALLSLLGGFLTPSLLSTGKDEQIVLFTYLLILGAGLLVIGARRNWHWLAPLSFALTQAYFWDWYATFYRGERLERTVVFATLFFLFYAGLPVVRAVRLFEVWEIDLLLLLLNSFAYLGVLYVLLWPQDRWSLTLFVLALSPAHLAVARFVPTPESGEPPLTRQLLQGLALTFATLAIPIRLEGKWITLAFAVEGAVLVWTGFRSLAPFLRRSGYLLLALAAFRFVIFPLPARQFLLNERFISYALLIACIGVALYAAREHTVEIAQNERNTLAVFAVAIHVFALLALSLECWDHFGRHAGLGMDSGLAQHLSLSLLWTTYACGLILFGVERQSALLRWQALVLFGLVVIKVFLYDSSYLERFYRIVSFSILGLVLLLVSFLYQRKSSGENSAP